MATYSGTFEGQHWQSLYPNIYRINYSSVMTGRRRDYTTLRSGVSEAHARQRIEGAHVVGPIQVELVHTLDLDPVPE